MRIWRGFKNHFAPSHHNAYRPHLLQRPWLLFFLAATLATEGFLVANLVARQADPNFLAAVVPAEVVALTNTQREANNVSDVTQNGLLAQAAQAKAADMAQKGYFSHIGPGGKTPWQWIAQFGYQYQYAGENLAVRFIDSTDVVNAWMQSPTHRANMVKPVYADIGVGVAQGIYEGQPATYVVQYFASPLGGQAPAQSVSTVASAGPASAPGAAAVEGASVSPVAQSNSFTQQVGRQLTRAFGNPQESAMWVLGSIATVLLLVIAFTVFMHTQIQPGTMVMSGAMVAVLALSFIVLNSHIVEGGAGASQAAGVIETTLPGGVVIGQKGESTGFALFPQAP